MKWGRLWSLVIDRPRCVRPCLIPSPGFASAASRVHKWVSGWIAATDATESEWCGPVGNLSLFFQLVPVIVPLRQLTHQEGYANSNDGEHASIENSEFD